MLHLLSCTGPGAHVRLGAIVCGDLPDLPVAGGPSGRPHAREGALRGLIVSPDCVKSTL